MRGILTAVLALLVAAAPLHQTHAQSAARYVPGTEDVPLMPGLATVADGALLFDKPEGRIVQASAKGAVTRAGVLAFYAASLPPLGWTVRDGQHFEREGERLSLDLAGPDGKLVVGFTLAPH